MAVTYTSGYPATATGYAFTDAAMALLRRYYTDFKSMNDAAYAKAVYDYSVRGVNYAPRVDLTGIDPNSTSSLTVLEEMHEGLRQFRIEMIAVLSSLPLYITQSSKSVTPSYKAGTVISGLTYATGFTTTTQFAAAIQASYNTALDALADMIEAYDRYLNMRGQFIDPTTYAVIAPMTDGLMDALNAAWLCTVSGGAVTGGLIHTMRAEACDLFADALGYFKY